MLQNVTAKYGIDDKVYIAEVNMKPIYNFERKPIIYKPLPKYPAVTRDLSLLCDVDLPVGAINDAIIKGAGTVLEKIDLFDVYTGAQIPEGKKSVSYSITLRSADATLTDEQVEKVMAKVLKLLENLGATLRM